MRVLITGVTGFVGSALRAHLERAGHEVLGTTTHPESASPTHFVHRLGENVERRWLDGVDVLVHAAWDLAPDAGARNLDGSAAWRDAAAASGAHALFISTYSAYGDFPTAYGRDKAAAEALFAGSGACTLRPALVVGPGGLFARMVGMVGQRPIVFLPDGGRHAVELLDIGDLCDAVSICARDRRGGAQDLSAGRLPLSHVCAAIARALGRPRLMIAPVPLGPVVFALKALPRQRRAADIRERLLGYIENGRRERRSTLAELLGRVPTPPLASVLSQAPRVRLVHSRVLS